MKSLLGGCLIVLAIAIVGLSVAAYLGFRAAKPVIDAASYVGRAGELASAADRITNHTPFTPPASGELTSQQVDRFLAVQARVRAALDDRWSDLQAKSDALRRRVEQNASTASIGDVLGILSDFTGIYVNARRVQVDALNVQTFSQTEYAWVRLRVYEAAGLQLAGTLDLSALERLAREGETRTGVRLPDLPKPDVPKTNMELVAPHVGKLKAWLPMAFLGL